MQRSKTHAELDVSHSTKKAKKIIAVLNTFRDLKKCSVLDIGTGSGVIASQLSRLSKSVTSMDISDDRLEKEGYKFIKIKGTDFPFEDESFDVVISNHVIEHVPKSEQRKHIQEIRRVLRKGGVCYLATPNKYFILGQEHRMLLFSFGRIKDISHLTYSQLVGFSEGLNPLNMAVEIIKYPQKYKLDAYSSLQFMQFLPKSIIQMLSVFFPTNIVVFKKGS